MRGISTVPDKTPLDKRSTEELEKGLAQGVFGEGNKREVERILRERRRRDEAQEHETDRDLVREANRIAKSARTASWAAVVVAIIALLISLFW